MATTPTGNPTATTPTPEQAYEEFTSRAKAFNEDVLDSSKKAGTAVLDTVEKSLKSYADLHEEVGKALPFSWTTPVATAQASFVRELTDAYVTAGRQLTTAA
jgi:hypothetical protein